MRNAFSLVEVVIVVALIGIVAALVIPCFNGQTLQAKEAAAKDDLRALRSAIEFYAVRHRGVAPGYPDDDPARAPTVEEFRAQMSGPGRCLRAMPENPFNDLDTMYVVKNSEPFPAAATGAYGWIYQPVTKVIRLDWSGQDNAGVRYFDY
jgi:prepilin-type N-terminal cleavage/methylation domain-containing protein